MKYILFIFAALLLCFGSTAQTSPIKMHRIQATTKNGNGLYYAKSTEGNFSVLMPIPFNDFSVKDGNTTAYTIGSKNQEGIKFSVTEMAKNEKNKNVDIDVLMNNLKSPDNVISNVKKERTKTHESIYFSINDKSKGVICKYVLTANRLFFMIIEYPIAYREKAENDYGYFFSSLHITKQ